MTCRENQRSCQCHIFILAITVGLLCCNSITAQVADNSVKKLKDLSLEELMNIEVTTVSKKAEKLAEVASAIQVITQEDIRRSGVTNLPDALRLSPNLEVAQISAYAWIISARGFNAAFSNKLLVMIDGRVVYSPLFAGVFWDAQSVLLEDVDRIEIISGPGGTIWGANAVNGVINIINKKATDTQGLYASVGMGDFLKNEASIRYGGKAGKIFYYKAYLQRNDYGATMRSTNNTVNNDAWFLTQGGFRLDWTSSAKNIFMLQGNLYGSDEQTAPSKSSFTGQNIEGQWAHQFSDSSQLIIQAYYDRTWRHDIPSTISDKLETYDLDVQHNFNLNKTNSLVWGLGYRYMHNESEHSTTFLAFLPEIKDMYLFSSFVQDEISVAHDVKVTVGAKLQNNNYTQWEVQPSARLAWTPNDQNTVWAACSRAIRAPSRIDKDYYLPAYRVMSPDTPNVAGGPNFKSESVIAYELGYRVQPCSKLSLSLATFYNQYYNIYSVEAIPNTLTYQIQNGTEADSRGIELSGLYQPFTIWKLRGGYSYCLVNMWIKPGHVYNNYADLANDPQHIISLQSMLDLPKNFRFNTTIRYSGSRPKPATAKYFTYDVNISWTYKNIELAVIGQNLSQAEHVEYGGQSQIPRSVYGKLTCRL
ncbi:TonB-dependent receptor plug domain-containing protein [Ferruginibacter albus]|uniref:TonB-dependent receptor plug domain-containing protein n=1 Tax=Ferruginibacter albus TaxID=2875540 RepID=UPI001CC4BCE1|nr:TonB-dependent receptor [Ferruginibacter albus]UAY51542.1 TonB-dependent receptor [Ferruginibacter albus]